MRAGPPRERGAHLHGPIDQRLRGPDGAAPRGRRRRRTREERGAAERERGTHEEGYRPRLLKRAARAGRVAGGRRGRERGGRKGCFPPVAGGGRSALSAGGPRVLGPVVGARVSPGTVTRLGFPGASGSGGPPRSGRSWRETGPGIVEEEALEGRKPRRAPARPAPSLAREWVGRENGLPGGARLRSGRVGRSPPGDGAFEGPVEEARASASYAIG